VSLDRRRARAIHRRLLAYLGPLEPPRATDPLEELVLTVLSQHTSDTNAERAFDALRAAYPTWDEVVRARSAALADVIRSGGLANTKAPRIQAILREVRDREGAFNLAVLRDLDDREARDYLTSLPGVGPKTAAVVMAFALGRNTIPVDTHVHRVSGRLGLIPPRTSAEKAHRLLDEIVPDDLKTPMHVGLIRLGREVCKAARPRCQACPLRDVCPTAPQFLTAARIPER
jgi:endonuclease-3